MHIDIVAAVLCFLIPVGVSHAISTDISDSEFQQSNVSKFQLEKTHGV